MTAIWLNEIEPYCASWLHNLYPEATIETRSICDLAATDVVGTRAHFFAGIGGWEYALRLAGWPAERPVWTGSCPCQPFSVAGKGRGTDDARHLWPEFRRLIAECRPPAIFGEQVASRAGREWLAGVRADLEDLGYAVGAADLCAASLGASHIRQRLYWVAYASSTGLEKWGRQRGDDDQERATAERASRKSSGMADASSLELRSEPSTGAGFGTLSAGRGSDCGEPSDTGAGSLHASDDCRVDDSMCDEAPASKPSPESRRDGEDNGISRKTSAWDSSAYLPCRDGKWRRAPLAESGVQPLAHGVSADLGSVRPGEASPFRVIRDPKTGASIGQAPSRIGLLKGYGNAIVPQVAAAFVRAAQGLVTK